MAQILKSKCDSLLLAKLETFQTSFICTDTLVALLRNDVLEFEKRWLAADADDQLSNKNISSSLKRLRQNIIAAGHTFTQRQTAFNNYLSENIQ